MPGKKKKSASSQGLLRPEPVHQDSLRRDIQAAIQHNHDADENEEGLDIADQLLATLEARDKAAEKVHKASIEEERANQKHHHSNHTDLQSTSPLKHAGEKLLHAGEKMFGHHSNTTQVSPSHSPKAKSELTPQRITTVIPTDDVDKELATDMQRKGSIRRLFGGHSSPNNASEGGVSGGGKKKVSRQKARMERRAAEMEAQRLQAEEELKANGGKPDEAERERVAITDMCKALKVEMHEITPDGHCLYAAVADQLNILGKTPSSAKLKYLDTRKATAEYMRNHADDFMPFISDSDEHMAGIENKEAGLATHNMSQQEKYFMDYCNAIEKTAVWGGQPEIIALSRVFHTPIHVVQAGSPVMKVGAEDETIADQEPVIISYHRHMYGLGEHYNSLHKTKGA